MSPEKAIEAAAEILGPWLELAKTHDGSSLRKVLLGIEYVDAPLYPAKLQAAIDAAKHDAEMDAVLCSLGAPFIDQAENVPPLLRSFIANKLRTSEKTKTGKRGKHSHANLTRDFAIIYVIARLVERGFKPTRNPAQRTTDSACSLTTKALERVGVRMITESDVQKIWGNRSRLDPNLRKYVDEGEEDLPHGLTLGRVRK